jgi:hypothetical protein
MSDSVSVERIVLKEFTWQAKLECGHICYT